MQNNQQNRTYLSSNINKPHQKKNNQSSNIEAGKDEFSLKFQSDNTFYSPVKYFSNNLKTNNQKMELEELSPWQTNCEDVLNSTDLDFRYKSKKKKNIDKKSDFKNQNYDCCNNSNQVLPSQYNLSTSDNIDMSQSQISKTFYLQDLKQNKQNKVLKQQIQSKDLNENDENQQLKSQEKKVIQQPLKSVSKVKEDYNSQLSLSQLEIDQQNKLLQQIRRQRELCIQQMQKTKQLPQEISKTDVTTTPKKGELQKEIINFPHRKNQSYSSQNKSFNIQNAISAQNEIQSQQLNYNHIQESKLDLLENNNQNVIKDESITSKNKNRILSILDNALNSQKIVFQNKDQQEINQKNTFNISQKASQIQKNLEQNNNKPNQYDIQRIRNHQNNHYLQSSQQDQNAIQMRRQSYTQDPNLFQYQQGSNIVQENEQIKNSMPEINVFENETIEIHQNGRRNYFADINQQIQSNNQLLNKRDNLQSYLLNQNKTSNLIQQSSNLNNSEIYSKSTTINPSKNIYENVIAQIEKLKYSTKKQDKESQSFIYRETYKRTSTFEDQEEVQDQQQQQQGISQHQKKKNMSILLPLFKGAKNQEYKKVIKKFQNAQKVSPSQTRRNTDFNNVSEDYSFNSHIQNTDNYGAQQQEQYDQSYTESFTPKYTKLPPIQKEAIPKSRKSNSLLPESYSAFVPTRVTQYNKMAQRKHISPYKMMSSYSILDENIVNMIKNNQDRNINDPESFVHEDKQKIDFTQQNSNNNILKAVQDRHPTDSSTTPKRKKSENLKSQPQQNQNKTLNMQNLKQSEISSKKQKELSSLYKPSQLLTQISNAQTQQINLTNLSHSKIY